MFYETKDHHGLKHNPFKSLVVPRPIGWISSLDSEGRVNLAPFSFFNAVADDPPVVIFSAGGQHVEGGFKDTPLNVEATGEFVFNLATWALREKMNLTSVLAPRDWNEFEVAGLTPAPSRLVKPPRVKESPVHMECRYLQTVELPSRDAKSLNKVVFGKVVGIHIDDGIIKDGLVDLAAIKPIARLGYMDYTVVETIFTMQRPKLEDLPPPTGARSKAAE
ncbi:MAG: flavin reductase family protein [Rhodospirillales bacterium]|nr:flavin reductase family protein [Rhodospirillales bacterium]